MLADSDLVVDVVGAQSADDHADEGLADGHPLEVALGVAGGPLGPRLAGVARAPQQLADVVQVRVRRRARRTDAGERRD